MKKIFNQYKQYLLIIGIYLVVTIIFTYPLILHLGTDIYGSSGDPFGTLHYFWWSKTHDISYTFPNSPLFIGPAKLLAILFGEIITYNLFTIFGFVLTGIAGYLLVKKITKNQLAGFFSGLVLLLSPYHLSQSAQHLNFTDLSWLLFFIYFLLCSKRKPTLVNILLCGIFFIATALINYQYGFFALVIFIIFIFNVLTEVVFSKTFKLNKQIVGYIIPVILFSILAITLFNYQVFEDMVSIRRNEKVQVVPIRSESELEVYSARWFYYFYPSPQNPLLGKFTKDIYNNTAKELGSNLTEMELYLGWTLIILSFYYLLSMLAKWKMKPGGQKFTAVFFLLVGIVGLYFSFAPTMPIFGLNIKTPASWLYNYLPFFRVYSRFGLLVVIALSILSGLGLSLILEKIKSKKVSLFVCSLVSLIVLLEFLNFPPPHTTNVSEKAMPAVYQWLKNQPKSTIIEYPLLSYNEPKSYEYLLWRRYHGMDLAYYTQGGLIDDQLRQTILNPQNPVTINTLKNLGVKYIIIHQSSYTPENAIKYPLEYNDGQVPEIGLQGVELINQFKGDLIYQIE